MIEPSVSLAFTLESSPGVYAVLLGSGVSRAAGIPTGWEVTLDLIRKIAKATGEDCEPQPDEWFVHKYGKPPGYSELLSKLARTKDERNRLLRSYFEPSEPSDKEAEKEEKQPTTAHRAIADLAAMGIVRVIITTNFDRLMEKAFEEKGITPHVISTEDTVIGMPPISHGEFFVIKPHGDYLDGRFRNTPEELKKLDKNMSNLILRVFDEFGLIVCGWSAEWDTGLCSLMTRTTNRRYSVYWAIRGAPGEEATRLISHRGAVKIDIRDADSFFSDIAAKVEAIREYSHPHPLSVKATVASLKKYIAAEGEFIRLSDMVRGATEELVTELSPERFPLLTTDDKDAFLSHLHRYEGLTEKLLAIIIAGCYWGNTDHNRLWVDSLTRIANAMQMNLGGLTMPLQLRLYPALLLIYGSGMAALANEKYSAFCALLKDAVRREGGDHPLIEDMWPGEIIGTNVSPHLITARKPLPVNAYLHDFLREFFREYIPDDIPYTRNFDKFEYLCGLISLDIVARRNGDDFEGVSIYHVGSFIERGRRDGSRGYRVEQDVEGWFSKSPDGFPLITAGLFAGDPVRFSVVKAHYDKEIDERRQYRRGLRSR